MADVIFARFAEHAGHDFALLIQDQGGRKFIAQTCALEHIEIRSQPNLHLNRMRCDESVDGRAVLCFVGRSGNETHIPGRVFRVQLGKQRKFLATWRAPGGPEVYDGDRAAQIGGMPRLAGAIFEFQVWRSLGMRGCGRFLCAVRRSLARSAPTLAIRQKNSNPNSVELEIELWMGRLLRAPLPAAPRLRKRRRQTYAHEHCIANLPFRP